MYQDIVYVKYQLVLLIYIYYNQTWGKTLERLKHKNFLNISVTYLYLVYYSSVQYVINYKLSETKSNYSIPYKNMCTFITFLQNYKYISTV